MNRLALLAVALAAALVFTATVAQAVDLNATGGGTAAVVYGPREVSHFSHGAFQADLLDTIILKDFRLPAPLVFDPVEYSGGDLDFAGGFRWTERILNNSGVAWTDYHLRLDDTQGVFFTDLPTFSPSLVTINDGGDINATGPNTITFLSPLTLSADRKEIDIDFATPIPDGGFFDIHVPIEGLSPNGGSFVLTQDPSFIPEPSTVLIWSLLGALGAALGVWRRQRRV